MSELQYISDSDGDNSLPQLPESAIDMSLLNDFYSFLSRFFKGKTSNRGQKYLLWLLFNHLDNDFWRRKSKLFTASYHLQPGQSYPAHFKRNRMSWIRFLLQRMLQMIPHMTSLKTSSTETAFRSSRREISSRHPYIADQADWLGICTIDSINEMFTADEDLQKVVASVESLYLKRKKKISWWRSLQSQNFYAHLGQNKLLALQGDQMPSRLPNLRMNPYWYSKKMTILYRMKKWIMTTRKMMTTRTLSGLRTFKSLPSLQSRDTSTVTSTPRMESAEDTETSVSDENDDYEDEYVRVGGRFRKLKTIPPRSVAWICKEAWLL